MTENTEIVNMTADTLQRQADDWIARARAATIDGQESFDRAAEWLKAMAGLRAQIVEHYREPKAKASAAHKAICAAEKTMLAPIDNAAPILSNKVAAYMQEQKRKDLEAEQERRRQAAAQEQEARLNLAAQAEEMGASQTTVDEIMERPLPYVAPAAAPTYKKAAGVGLRETWKAEVFDFRQLVIACAAGKASMEFLTINWSNLHKAANAMKSTLNVPGVRAKPSAGVTIRRG